MKKLVLLLSFVLLLTAASAAQIDNNSDAGHGIAAGSYDSIDPATLYTTIDFPIFAKRLSARTPFSYDVTLMPNVFPGIVGQASPALGMTVAPYGGISFSASKSSYTSCLISPGLYAKVPVFSSFGFYDGGGVFHSFKKTGGTTNLACSGDNQQFTAQDGTGFSMKASVNTLYQMFYTVYGPDGTIYANNVQGGSLLQGGWAASTVTPIGSVVVDPNGNEQMVTGCDAQWNCKSGTVRPSWNSQSGGTTTDNNLTWTNKGLPGASVLDVDGNAFTMVSSNLLSASITANNWNLFGRNLSQSTNLNYTDPNGTTVFNVLYPAYLTSSGTPVPTAQTTMTYTDANGATQHAYVNTAAMLADTATWNLYCPNTVNVTQSQSGNYAVSVTSTGPQGPLFLGINGSMGVGDVTPATIQAGPTANANEGNSFLTAALGYQYPTSIVQADGQTMSFTYETAKESKAGSTTGTNVTVSNNVATVTLGAANLVTKLSLVSNINSTAQTFTNASQTWAVGDVVALYTTYGTAFIEISAINGSTISYVPAPFAPVSQYATTGFITGAPGAITLSGFTTATFLNGLTVTNWSYAASDLTGKTITFPLTHANYTQTSDSGTIASAKAITGRIASMVLPTGGTVSYAYSGGTQGLGWACGDNSTYTLKRTTPDGVTTYTHSFPNSINPTAQTSGLSTTSQTVITDAAGNEKVLQYNGIRVVDEQVYTGTPATTLVNASFDTGDFTNWTQTSTGTQLPPSTLTFSFPAATLQNVGSTDSWSVVSNGQPPPAQLYFTQSIPGPGSGSDNAYLTNLTPGSGNTSGATVTDITVTVVYIIAQNPPPNGGWDFNVQLMKNGSPIGSVLTSANCVQGQSPHSSWWLFTCDGGLWGTTWQPSDIVSPGFGVNTQVTSPNSGSFQAYFYGSVSVTEGGGTQSNPWNVVTSANGLTPVAGTYFTNTNAPGPATLTNGTLVPVTPGDWLSYGGYINATYNIPVWSCCSQTYSQGSVVNYNRLVQGVYVQSYFVVTAAAGAPAGDYPTDTTYWAPYIPEYGLTCNFLNGSGTVIGSCPIIGQPGSNSATIYTIPTTYSNWNYFSNVVMVPANAASAQFVAAIHNNNDLSSGLFIDFSADQLSMIDLSTSKLAQRSMTCYGTTTLYVGANGDASPCLTLPLVTINTVPTNVNAYNYTPGTAGPSAVVSTFDTLGRKTNEQYFDFGATAATAIKNVTYGTYNGTINATDNPANCVPVANTAIIDSVCESHMSNPAGAKWNQVVAVYNANGEPTTINVVDTADAKNFATTYAYTKGHISSVTQPNGVASSASYTLCGNNLPSSVTLGSFTSSSSWNCASGLLTSTTDINGGVWTSTFDSMNRILTTKTPLTSSSFTDTVTYGYAANSQTASMTFNSGASVINNVFTFDSMGREVLAQEETAAGVYNSQNVSLNTLGQPKYEYLTYTGALGATAPSGTKYTAYTAYDGMGRVTNWAVPQGQPVTATYKGRDVVIATGNVSEQREYDSFGRILSICQISTSVTGNGPCGQDNSATGFETTFAYNAQGDLATVTRNANLATSQVYSLIYDGDRRRISMTTPARGTVIDVWDSDPAGVCTAFKGSVVRESDANGNVVCFGYDTYSRLTSITYPSGPNSSSTPQRHFVYDTVTNSSFTCPSGSTYTKGFMVEAYTGPSTAKLTDEGFCYNKNGKLTDTFEITPHSHSTFHTTVTFWENGQVKTLSGVPSTPTITYNMGYNAIASVSASSGQNPVTSVVRNPDSRLSTITFGSGDSDTLTYDTYGRWTGYNSTAGSNTITGALTWNAVGTPSTFNITDPINSSNTQNCSFGWNNLDYITSYTCKNGTTDIWGQTFTADTFGNEKKGLYAGYPAGTKWNPTYTNSNQYTGSTFAYDSNGFSTNDTINTYVWNADSTLSSLTNIANGKTDTFTYDAFGKMVEEYNGTFYYQFVMSPLGKVATTSTTN